MIKLIAIGLWVCGITLASVYYSIKISSEPKKPAKDAKVAMKTVEGKVITVPVLGKGEVEGYFLVRMSYVGDAKKMAAAHLPLNDVASDVVMTQFVGNKILQPENTSNFNLAAFRKTVRDSINYEVGEDLVTRVLVLQMDYMSKQDIKKLTADGRLKKDVNSASAKKEDVSAAAH